MWQYNYQDELYHHGILGMKWGVRRFQNKDGTLTSAGKRRYKETKDLVDAANGMVGNVKKITSSNTKKRKKLDLSEMTDQQLREKINRELLEKQYTNLFAQETTASKGKSYVNDILTATSLALGVGSSALSIALAMKALKG
jgi:SLT domain-containing protein